MLSPVKKTIIPKNYAAIPHTCHNCQKNFSFQTYNPEQRKYCLLNKRQWGTSESWEGLLGSGDWTMLKVPDD